MTKKVTKKWTKIETKPENIKSNATEADHRVAEGVLTRIYLLRRGSASSSRRRSWGRSSCRCLCWPLTPDALHAYLACWPVRRPPLRSAAERRARRSAGRRVSRPRTAARHGTTEKPGGEKHLHHFLLNKHSRLHTAAQRRLTCLTAAGWRLTVCCSERCFTAWAEEEEEDEEAGGVACCRRRCSISCSCWSAFTNAAFSRLVCSAFRTFLWLDDMHCSHIVAPPLSLRQRQVKSVLHWEQQDGSPALTTKPAYRPCLPETHTLILWNMNILAEY